MRSLAKHREVWLVLAIVAMTRSSGDYIDNRRI